MGDEHPIDDALNEVEKILKMLEQVKIDGLKESDFEAFKDKIAGLDKDVTAFAEKTDEILKDIGISDMSLKAALEDIPADLPEDDKEALKRAKELKDEAIRLKKEMTGSSEFLQDEKAPYKKKDKMLSKEEHRSKYKRLGSKKKWKPL